MLRKVKELVILGVVIGLVALAYRDIVVREYPPVTLTLTQVTRQEALEQVTAQLGITLIQSARESQYENRDDFRFENAPVSEVLVRLAEDWKLIGDVLIVTPVSGGEEYCRMEYLLDEAPARIVLPELKLGFPEVIFTAHPTMNGFYTKGSREDLLAIKRMLGQMDHVPLPPLPTLQREHTVQHLDAAELEERVRTLHPGVGVKRDGGRLMLEGTLPDTGQALSFLHDVDRETIIVPVSLTELRQAESTCRLGDYYLTPRVDCKPGCQGPLHLLGLQIGDVLEDHRNDDLRDKPEWWVKRAGRDYRIVLRVGR